MTTKAKVSNKSEIIIVYRDARLGSPQVAYCSLTHLTESQAISSTQSISLTFLQGQFKECIGTLKIMLT